MPQFGQPEITQAQPGFFNRIWQRVRSWGHTETTPTDAAPTLNGLQLNLDLLSISLPPMTFNFNTLDLAGIQESVRQNLLQSQHETHEHIRRLIASEPLQSPPLFRDYRHFHFFNPEQTSMYEDIRRAHRQWEQHQAEEVYRWWQTQRQQNAPGELAVPDETRNAEKLAFLPDLEIPEEFLCTISREIMTNPVYDPRCPQQKFDLLVIRRWLDNPPTDPMTDERLPSTHPVTRAPLTLDQLVYDEVLKEQIEEFVARSLQTSTKPGMSHLNS